MGRYEINHVIRGIHEWTIHHNDVTSGTSSWAAVPSISRWRVADILIGMWVRQLCCDMSSGSVFRFPHTSHGPVWRVEGLSGANVSGNWNNIKLYCFRCNIYTILSNYRANSIRQIKHAYAYWSACCNNKELHDLYSSPSTIRIIKSRRMRWAGHVARMGRREMLIDYWWESQRERDH
jgi:hypothetical protein